METRAQKIEKAMKIVHDEWRMRWSVFRNDPQKQEAKCTEMKYVKELLEEIKAEEQPSLFP